MTSPGGLAVGEDKTPTDPRSGAKEDYLTPSHLGQGGAH
jgi:hypothetical protein